VKTPTQTAGARAHAEAAAEAIRALNHATMWAGPEGYQEPADVDAVIGSLAMLAACLPQALAQADRWLCEALDAHRVRHDQGGDVAHGVFSASLCLEDAAGAAGNLFGFLREARAHSSHLAGLDGGEAR